MSSRFSAHRANVLAPRVEVEERAFAAQSQWVATTRESVNNATASGKHLRLIVGRSEWVHLDLFDVRGVADEALVGVVVDRVELIYRGESLRFGGEEKDGAYLL